MNHLPPVIFSEMNIKYLKADILSRCKFVFRMSYFKQLNNKIFIIP